MAKISLIIESKLLEVIISRSFESDASYASYFETRSVLEEVYKASVAALSANFKTKESR